MASMSEMGKPNKQRIPSASLQASSSTGILPAMRARRFDLAQGRLPDSRRDCGATGSAGDECRRRYPRLASKGRTRTWGTMLFVAENGFPIPIKIPTQANPGLELATINLGLQ